MTQPLSTLDTVLEESAWRERRARHETRVRPWVEPRQERRKNGGKHPTDDFLFEYYPYSVGKLLAWHQPGLLLLQAPGFPAHSMAARSSL